MNARTYIEPALLVARPLLHVVAPPPDATDLAIDEAIALRWRALAGATHVRITAFLANATTLAHTYTPEGTMPPDFARDLANGGRAFRAAFPELARRIVAVDQNGAAVTVRMRCEGDHRAPFYGIFSATGRRLAFDVMHHLVVRDGAVVDHRVAIDVRALVVQLALSPKMKA